MKKTNTNLHKRNKTINQSQSNHFYLFNLLPIIFFTSVVIFITRLKVYENIYKEFWWNQQTEQLYDFFSYYKAYAIIACTLFSLLIFAILFIQKKIQLKKTAFYIPIFIYTVFIILSYVFSKYKMVALVGWGERFEGTIILSCYMLMLFIIINLVNSERDVKAVVSSIIVACCLLGLLGITQAIGHDFFTTIIGKKIIIPQEYWSYLDEISFKFQHNEIYQTVYNINYVSFYLTLVIPIAGVFYLKSDTKKSKILYALIFILLIYNMFGASSSGGYLGLAVSLIVAIIIFWKKLFGKRKELLALVALIAIAIAANLNTLAPELTDTIRSSLFGEATMQVHESNNALAPNDSSHAKKPSMEYIKTDKDSITISLNKEIIKFRIENKSKDYSTSIFDGSGKPLNVKALKKGDGYTYEIDDKRFAFLTIDLGEEGQDRYIVINLPELSMPFLIGEQEILYKTSYGALTPLRKIEAFGFKGIEGFGSGRGYIWSRSLPLVKDTLLWGNGADTFAAYFPQDDFAGKYTGPSFSRDINSIIRKPHSLYLGYAINTGLASLLSMLSLFLAYIVQSFIIYRREDLDSYIAKAGAGIFIGICGFLTAGLVYDSSVCVMPLFYGLLGTGIAINMTLHPMKSQ